MGDLGIETNTNRCRVHSSYSMLICWELGTRLQSRAHFREWMDHGSEALNWTILDCDAAEHSSESRPTSYRVSPVIYRINILPRLTMLAYDGCSLEKLLVAVQTFEAAASRLETPTLRSP